MTIPAGQRAAAHHLASLSGGPPTETHISAVFIGADTVWKLKKAVTLPFLDFAGLDAREHFLRRELILNKPAASGIYRDVIAIVRQPDGTLKLGSGNPVDWVLRMAPIPAGDFLDVIASNGALTPGLLDGLGDCVAAYHSKLAAVSNQDSATGFRRITAGNVRSALANGLPRPEVEAWHRRMMAAIEDREDWLKQRSRAGYVRRCHGDLHLGNLCLWEGLRRELILNKPAASGIYRDVIAIVRQPDGTLKLGSGNPVDWVLRMAPIPAGDFLDVIASNGALTPGLLDGLGDCVAAYHSKLAAVSNQDSATGFRRITAGNVRSALANGLPRPEVEAWHRRMMAAIEDREDWLKQRSRAGYVRRCHGDLHLGNLCLWEGKPVAFDALEFDEELATIDIAYDLAFLLMDLDHRVSREAANRVMNRYVARTGDIAVRGFAIFLSQRAMVRAHVLSAMDQDGAAYLTAAQSYLDPAPSRVIAIGGLQGTGKSTIARALAAELGAAPGALIVRSDEVRKQMNQAEPETRLGPAAYTRAANAATNVAVAERALAAATSGHTVIVDATFLNPAWREALAAAVRHAGIPFLGIWLHAPVAVLEARIASRRGDASDATVSVLHQAAQHDPGPGDWRPVDASEMPHAVQGVRQAIRSTRSR